MTPFRNESKEDFILRAIDAGISSDEAVRLAEQVYSIEQIAEVTVDIDTGIDKISLVGSPAIEHDWVAMNKVELKYADEDKQIITGPVLIPEQLIYRVNQSTNEPYYQYFTADTIRTIVEKYFMEHKQDNVNLEHEYPVKSVCVFESWLIEDSDNDKSKALGYNLPKGTWMVSMKVNNQEVWQDLVKKGTLNGFSIEGPFVIKQSKLSDDVILKAILDLLAQETEDDDIDISIED